MKNLIKYRIDDYIGFDSDELFTSDMVRIFGGAIRDSICGDDINDIDILCGSNSAKVVSNILISKGYIHFNKLSGREIQSMYSDIHIINEPQTWIKGDRIIQLIRPSFSYIRDSKNNEILYKSGFISLIKNVDISCCGISYDKNGLYENFNNAQ